MTPTEVKWSERVGEWKASGQSADEFSQGREFKASTLRWWASRIGRGAVGERRKARSARVRMVRVVPREKSDAALTVRVGGAQIDVRAGFDGSLLRELVAALGGER
jgi:hypothetical protein